MSRLGVAVVVGVLVSCTSARTGSGGPAPLGSSAAVAKAAPDASRGRDASRNSNGTLRDFGPLPKGIPGRAVVFRYEDFGPESLATPLLGAECYPFGACCCSEPDDRFDVRVVVYTGPEGDLREKYPSGPTLGDYRFVPRTAALAHVDAALRDLEGAGADDGLTGLVARLRATRKTLVEAFR